MKPTTTTIFIVLSLITENGLKKWRRRRSTHFEASQRLLSLLYIATAKEMAMCNDITHLKPSLLHLHRIMLK